MLVEKLFETLKNHPPEVVHKFLIRHYMQSGVVALIVALPLFGATLIESIVMGIVIYGAVWWQTRREFRKFLELKNKHTQNKNL